MYVANMYFTSFPFARDLEVKLERVEEAPDVNNNEYHKIRLRLVLF